MPIYRHVRGRTLVALGLTALPKRALTLAAGRLLRSRLSRLWIPLFARKYGICLEECERDWRQYDTLASFFSRRLRPGLRGLAESDDTVLVSPVDGIIAACGRITDDTLVQAKGRHYSLRALLTDRGSEFVGGQYVTVYLSPGDYHRIHAPTSGAIVRAVHVAGTLFPVNQWGAQSIAGLFTRNERVVCWIRRHAGTVALVSVGSLIVGSVVLCDKLVTVRKGRSRRGQVRALLDEPVAVSRGEELGWFEFGSTVILVFGQGQVRLDVALGERVRAMQPIGQFVGDLSRADAAERGAAGAPPSSTL